MIKIPATNWQQANNSDRFGNISSTRNINFDSEGYLTLSSRSFSVYSSDTNDADFDPEGDLGTVLSLGRYSEGAFVGVASDIPFLIDISNTTFSNQEDGNAGVPTPSINSWGTFWQNRWYVTSSIATFYKDIASGAGGNWTNASVALTTGVTHVMELFRNRKTMCISNGNEVIQVDTTHSEGTLAQLLIPSDYEIIGMAYSNNKMGIVTRLAATVEGQGQDAFFFVWDGSSASAGTGVPVGSDSSVVLSAYKGTWVILTRTGQLLIWNGSGFVPLGAFPFYYKGLYWGGFLNKVGYGQMMWVEGDLIYINVDLGLSKFNRNQEEYLPYNPSGTWCYDPAVGLYHRYSPSISWASALTVTSGNVATATGIMTTSQPIPSTGEMIRYTEATSGAIGGLDLHQDYYVVKISSTKFKVATSRQNAIDGQFITLTSTGSANNYFIGFEIRDYGAVAIAQSGAVTGMGISDQYADHLISGASLYNTAGDSKDYIQVTVPYIENRGEVVTAKLFASSTEDAIPKVTVRFKTLTGSDTIVVKEKFEDLVGLPVSTVQNNTTSNCTWTSTTVCTTTAILDDVVTAYNAGKDIEVLILSGAGAGALVKLSSITELSGTYTITVEEAILGVSATLKSDLQFDNFKVKATITADSVENQKGYIEALIAENSKWSLFKLELRGVKTTIEEIIIPNVKHS